MIIAPHLAMKSEATFFDYWALLKPRVMSLVIFTGLCGILLAPGHVHPVISLTALICIAAGAGAAGALNMWCDRDIDGIMKRTQERPIPRQVIAPQDALAFGIILAGFSVMIMGVGVNWLSAGLLAFTIFFYAVIYSMWLKRRTPQNIVIGGLSGALPPVIGWAAVENATHLEPWILAALIFMWTPPHFWALSLRLQHDYHHAKVPMLPNVVGTDATIRAILYYTILLIALSFLPVILGYYGMIYLVATGSVGVGFLYYTIQLWRGRADPMRVFSFSMVYLFIIFLSAVMDRYYL